MYFQQKLLYIQTSKREDKEKRAWGVNNGTSACRVCGEGLGGGEHNFSFFSFVLSKDVYLMNKALASLESDLAALNLLVDVVCDVDERLLDVLCSLGRGLEEEETILFGELLTLLGLYDTAVFKISLVADQHDCGVLTRVLAAVLQPGGEVVKGLTTSDIVHEESASSVAVVAPSNRAELLLTGGIPNLQLNLLAADGDGATAELDTDGQIVDGLEALIGELKKEATLTDSSITDNDVLEEVLVLQIDLRNLCRIRCS